MKSKAMDLMGVVIIIVTVCALCWAIWDGWQIQIGEKEKGTFMRIHQLPLKRFFKKPHAD